MTKTVVGLFDTLDDANRTVRDLVDLGLARQDISLVSQNESGATETRSVGDAGGTGAGAGAGIGAAAGGALGLLVGLGALAIPGIGPVLAAGPLAAAIGTAAGAISGTAVGAGVGAAVGGLMGALLDTGLSEEEANLYTEGVRRGGTLVMATAADDMTGRVRDIMDRNHAVNVDNRGGEWRQSGWTRFDPQAGPYKTSRDYDTARTGTARTAGRDESLGEKWDESSKVGTAGGAVAGAAEGALAGGVAGPVGAVVGGIAGAAVGAGLGAGADAAAKGAQDSFDKHDADFQNHYRTYYGDSGTTYDTYLPGYRYGYGLASDPTFKGQSWTSIEPEVRRRWEIEHPNSWERFKDSIRYSWDRARSAVS